MKASQRFACHLLLVFFVLVGTAGQAEEIVLNPSKDNTLYESTTGNVSNGAGSRLFAGTTDNGDIRRAVIGFDLSAVPEGSTVDSVSLTMNMSRSVAGAQTVSLHRALRDWGEGTSNASGQEGGGATAAAGDATWLHTFFDTDMWMNAGGDFAAPISSSTSVGSTGSYTWPSTPQLVADVQSWIDNPASNFGWIVLGSEAVVRTAKRFDSRESTSPPVLTVQYSPADVQPGSVRFSQSAFAADETDGAVAITVVREGGSDGEVSVDFAAAEGTASDGLDFVGNAGTLTFGDGEQGEQSFDVTILDDADAEGDETVVLALSNVSGGVTLGEPSGAILTIADNDMEAVFSMPLVSIPAVASLTGPPVWTSRVNAGNLGDTDMVSVVRYTPRSGAENALDYTLNIPANTVLTIEDPLNQWFGVTGVGSLMFSVPDAKSHHLPLVQSAIFATNTDGTAYGQFFPAIATADGLVAGEHGYLHTTPDATHNRVNFGTMAFEDGTEVWAQPEDPAGTALADAETFMLDMGESAQLNNLNNVFGLDSTAQDYVVHWGVTTGSATGYVSVADGKGDASEYPGTNDPTTISPPSVGNKVTLLELGPIGGQGGSQFSGSASVTNLSPTDTTVTAEFYPRNRNASMLTETVDIAAGDTVGYFDIVGDLFATSGVGAVVLTASGEALLAASGREFSFFTDEAKDSHFVGTAGQGIPGMTDDELTEVGTTYNFIGLQETGDERSHIAAFNPGDTDVTLPITMYDGDTNAQEGDVYTLVIPAGKLVQENNILNKILSGQDGSEKRLEVTADGGVFVKCFRANKDNDPITIDGFRGS